MIVTLGNSPGKETATMHSRASALGTLFLAIAAPLGFAQIQAQARAPHESIVLPGTTEKISAHVYVIPDPDTTPGVPNVGIVVGTRAALVIDTGMGERNGRTVLAETEKVAQGRVLYLVSTHVHPEHDLGAGAFPASTKMIRSADEQKDIDEFGLQMAQTFASRSTLNADLLRDATFRKADITFDKEYDLDLGGVSVRILAMGPNHTRGDTAMFVQGDRVLFSGDDAMHGQPAFASPYSSLAHWLASLGVLAALQPAIVVPSHGPLGDAAFITGYRTYLTTIRDRTAVLKRQGRTLDEAVKTISAEMQPHYPDAGRLAGAIRAAYTEAP
jgi:glyoxylase-like metal-dependent hydrolase (beta-lactamase superfamily II)